MSQAKLGVDVQDLPLPTKAALGKAAELDFRLIELPAVEGEVSPTNLSKSGRRHLSHLVDSLGLSMAALVGDVPQTRLTDPQTVGKRVEVTLQVLALAADALVGDDAASRLSVWLRSLRPLSPPQHHLPNLSSLRALPLRHGAK